MSDPELYESAGQYFLSHEIDENYAKLMYHQGLSHEEATIKSRQMAGLDVKDDAPIAPQNAADAALVQRYKNAMEARKVPGLEKENMRMAGQAKAMMNLIDKYQIKYHELLDQFGMTGMPGEISPLEKLYRDAESARKTELKSNALLKKELRRANADAEFGSKKNSKRLAGVVLAALAGGAGTNEIIEYLQGPTIEEMEYYR
jgi:hypothetical protein